MAQKPVRYQCNQPRSVRAGNLAPEVVTFSPFRSHVTLCFLWWWTLHHFLCRFFNARSKSNRNIGQICWNIFLSCQISVNQCEAWTSANVKKKNRENYVPRVMTSLLMSSAPISIWHPRFRCRYSNSRDVPVVASPPSFSRPAARAPRRAYSQAYPGLQLRVLFLHHSISVVCRYGRAAI